MDANTIIQIISSLGFPIVMCGALFWYMVKQRQTHQAETEHLRHDFGKYESISRTNNTN